MQIVLPCVFLIEKEFDEITCNKNESTLINYSNTRS